MFKYVRNQEKHDRQGEEMKEIDTDDPIQSNTQSRSEDGEKKTVNTLSQHIMNLT